MSESSILIDQAIGAELAPRLKALGFAKKARNFRRTTPGSLQHAACPARSPASPSKAALRSGLDAVASVEVF
ncbi:MAG: DUF4304 domain-containing protein [Polyangiaceae bacterium]